MLGEVDDTETPGAETLYKVIDILDVALVRVDEPLLRQHQLVVIVDIVVFHDL